MADKGTVGGCHDIQDQYGSDGGLDAFCKVISGKQGYKTLREAEKKKCSCGYELKGKEKFCPECGAKTESA